MNFLGILEPRPPNLQQRLNFYIQNNLKLSVVQSSPPWLEKESRFLIYFGFGSPPSPHPRPSYSITEIVFGDTNFTDGENYAFE